MSAWELLVDGVHRASVDTDAADGTRTAVLSGLPGRPSGAIHTMRVDHPRVGRP